MAEDVNVEAGTKIDTWLVGPSWMVCAQLQAALPQANVGCATDHKTDFDGWAPPSRWKHADAIVFVTDDRMPVDASALVPGFHLERSTRVTLLRGGRVARTFKVSLLERRAGA